MKPDLSSRPVSSSTVSSNRVSNIAAAEFLVTAQSFRFLEPFLAKSNTVSNAAGLLKVDISSLLYRVKQMRALGLLEVTRIETRAGRAVRHYRSVRDEFFVPFALTSADTLRSLSAQFTAEFQQMFDAAFGATLERRGAAHDLGIRIWRNPDGHTSRDLMPAALASGDTTLGEWMLKAAMPAIWNQHALLRLSESDGKALQLELARVWQTYLSREDEGGRFYALRLAVAPLE